MAINWPAVEAIGVWVAAFAAIGAFAATLYSLRHISTQARAAAEQAAAASKQLEALSRPFVVVPCSSTMTSDIGTILGYDVIPSEIAGSHAALVNAGSGPALNLTWSYERVHQVLKGSCAYIRADGVFEFFGFSPELGVGPKRITCEYESVNGIRYRSTITLEDRNVLSCKIDQIG